MGKKQWMLAAVATAVMGVMAAYAGTTRDVYTDGARSVGARDPYTDGGVAGRFDVYSDGAKMGDKRDPFVDGA